MPFPVLPQSGGPKESLITARNGMAFRLCELKAASGSAHGFQRVFFRHARTEDIKLRKDPFLEVLALKVPFRSCRFFWNQASESSPVAGTT
jgi:hypothetical protein